MIPAHTFEGPSGAAAQRHRVHLPFLWQVAVVPDEVGVVAAEVQAASAACEMVITSGGVGPTLDDVTMAAVARAMEYPLARSVRLGHLLAQRVNKGVRPHMLSPVLRLVCIVVI